MDRFNHKVICTTHGALVPLSDHCNNIVRFLRHKNPYDDTVWSWFKIASGITSVEYNSMLFDEDVGWCLPAYEYENEKSEYHSKLIKGLTIFTYIWGGFEALISSLKLKPCPNARGKINSALYFLKSNYDVMHSNIEVLDELVEYLVSLLNVNPWYHDINQHLKTKNCVGKSGLGLSHVYKIRNKFAHGAFTFSEPEEFNRIKPFDLQIIVASCRVILLTTQMLLLTKNHGKKEVIELHEHLTDDFEVRTVTLDIFLLTFHLKHYFYSVV